MFKKKWEVIAFVGNKSEDEDEKSNVLEMAYASGVVCKVSAKCETYLLIVKGVVARNK